MKTRSKISLFGALLAISVPPIITTVSCGQSEKYSISINDNRVVLSTYGATKGEQLEIKLKTIDSEKCQLTDITDVKVNSLSIKGKYEFNYEEPGSKWTHYLKIDEDVVIDGSIEIEADVTVNQFSVSVNDEVDFMANSLQCYHDTAILLGTRPGSNDSIEGIKSVTINGNELSADYYQFSRYVGNKQYTHSVTIKEDKEHPHILSGDISINLDVQPTFCTLSCSDNVLISKEKVLKGQKFSVWLNASDSGQVITSVNEVQIGGQATDKYELRLAPATAIQYTHELVLTDASLITNDIYISMNTASAPTWSITLNDTNIDASADKVIQGQSLHLFMWPKNGYKLDASITVKVNGLTLMKGWDYTYQEYKGTDFPDGTWELMIDDDKITGNIEVNLEPYKAFALLSIDDMPGKIDAALSATSFPYGNTRDKTVDVSITYPDDWKFKNDGNIDVIIGTSTKSNAAKITAKDTPGEYTISFNDLYAINGDIVFCIGKQIELTKITYEHQIFDIETGDPIDDSSICKVDSETLEEDFYHGDRVEADIVTSTEWPGVYNYIFNDVEITLVSKTQEKYTLVKSADYDILFDQDDAKTAHIVIFEGVIVEPSTWNSKLDKIVFKYTMLDTIEKFSFFITDGVSTNAYLMPSTKTFTHTLDEDVVDKTKELKQAIVQRKESGIWTTLTEGYEIVDGELKIAQTAITGDIKVELKMHAPDETTFKNDKWEKIAYWASAGDAKLLAEVYNYNNKEDLLNLERTVTYDGIEQKVKVIGVNHDYLKYAEEGDMSGDKGKTAALTFEFVDLLKDSSGAVKLDIGETETTEQKAFWRYNEGFDGKGSWGYQSNIRTYLKNKFASKFDPEVVPWVKTVSKRRMANCEISTTSRQTLKRTKFMIFNDQYFIATVTELNGSHGKEGTMAKNYVREGTVYEGYDNGTDGYDYEWKPRAKKVNGSYREYWTSSLSTLSSSSYKMYYDYGVYIYGESKSYGCPISQPIDYDMCIAPCFCI